MEELDELEKTKKLTAKQEEFCRQYILTLNQTSAYQNAYGVERETARKLAPRLMSNDVVRSRIKEMKLEIQEKYEIKVEDLIARAMEIYNLGIVGQPQVKLDIKGKPVKTGNTERDLKAANEALKNIGLWSGLNTEKIKAEIEATADVNVMTAKDVAKAIMDITPETKKIEDDIDA